MKSENNIILIGMPAVGKSTVGVLLAKRLGLSFVDTDILIQAGEGKTLQDIIDSQGLARFREIEQSYMLGLSCARHVIATGGSVIYSEKAMTRLASSGVILHMDIDIQSLKQRLHDIRSRGVVMEPGENIEDLYEKRRPLYQRHAHVAVACKGLDPGQVVEQAIHALSRAGKSPGKKA
ncbi:MAG: shikimate kinase [Thermodesulfobacteriota bacterium]